MSKRKAAHMCLRVARVLRELENDRMLDRKPYNAWCELSGRTLSRRLAGVVSSTHTKRLRDAARPFLS